MGAPYLLMYMAHERRAHILRLLAERGSIRSVALAAELGVTDETIRTDLVLLEQEGQLRRRRGGAEFLPVTQKAPGSAATSRLDRELVEALLPHIEEGTRLAVDDSRLCRSLLALLAARPLTLITHAPGVLQSLAAESLPQRVLCIGGEVDKACERLIPTPGALAAASPALAVLSPERVELSEQEVAILYTQRADQQWAQELVTAGTPLLLAVPASALAPWSGKALRCSPCLLVTEDHLPAGATPPHVHLLPWLDPDSLLAESGFDY